MSKKTNQIKVLICDDHAVWRAGLAAVLEKENDIIVTEASNGKEAIKKASDFNPDVVFMDFYMPGEDGLQTTKNLLKSSPSSKVIMLTVSERQDHIIGASRNGVFGYLSKDSSIEEIIKALYKVARGNKAFSPDVAAKLANELNDIKGQPSLGLREREVLELVGDGFSNEEIASQLGISKNTVRTNIYRLMKKLNLKNRSQIVAYVLNKRIPTEQYGGRYWTTGRTFAQTFKLDKNKEI